MLPVPDRSLRGLPSVELPVLFQWAFWRMLGLHAGTVEFDWRQSLTFSNFSLKRLGAKMDSCATGNWTGNDTHLLADNVVHPLNPRAIIRRSRWRVLKQPPIMVVWSKKKSYRVKKKF